LTQPVGMASKSCENNLKSLCSSRDGGPLGPEKDTCRQDSLPKWINWYQSRPAFVFIRQHQGGLKDTEHKPLGRLYLGVT
jgi:hypothetical protein